MVSSAFRLSNVSEFGRSVFLPSCSRKIVAESVLFQEMWLFGRKGPSGFSSASTAEEVTNGIDASGLTAIVTGHNFARFTTTAGASSGIGSETARVLALRGVHVIMGVRNMAAGKKVKETIVKQIPAAKVDAMELDLSSLASVEICFRVYFLRSSIEHIDVSREQKLKLNNAGVMATPFKLSQDNIELQFATNHLGHFLLANLLLDTMKKTARQTKREGRIVNVSSEAHRVSYEEGIRFDRLNNREQYKRWGAYGQSKLANVLHANELARRLKDEGADITANSLHPGVISTNLFRHLGVFAGTSAVGWSDHRFPANFCLVPLRAGFVSTLGKLVLKNVQQGASTTCYVALRPELKGVRGEYFSDNNLAKASAKAADTDLAKKLWEFSLDLIKK
ncbi:UNVERIFIED_CONTAM: Short-chain dehydrogenase, chloroplastic [Sesamum radiatum]|uniref:Short-chain dehydrogenase, chloroplastic n=1 Tax=Sesamum radiatum TaxID=300843 RepID=A0AAW2NBA6_SESRA